MISLSLNYRSDKIRLSLSQLSASSALCPPVAACATASSCTVELHSSPPLRQLCHLLSAQHPRQPSLRSRQPSCRSSSAAALIVQRMSSTSSLSEQSWTLVRRLCLWTAPAAPATHPGGAATAATAVMPGSPTPMRSTVVRMSVSSGGEEISALCKRGWMNSSDLSPSARMQSRRGLCR